MRRRSSINKFTRFSAFLKILPLICVACGPSGSLVATRAMRVDGDQGLKALAVESMFETKGLHGRQLVYRVGIIDSRQVPVRAPGSRFRDENGMIAASKALIAEEVTGSPTHVRVQIPIDAIGLTEREIPAYGLARLMLPTGEILAESSVRLPVDFPDLSGGSGYTTGATSPGFERRADAGTGERDGWQDENAGQTEDRVTQRNSGSLEGEDWYIQQQRNAESGRNQRPQNKTYNEAIAREISENEALVRSDPNNLQNQLRLRMNYIAVGRNSDALAYIPGTHPEVHTQIIESVAKLVPAESTNTPPQVAKATPRRESFARPVEQPRVKPKQPTQSPNRDVAGRPHDDQIRKESRVTVEASADRQAPLTIPRAAICERINGFRDYRPFEPASFSTWSLPKLLVYMEVENFETTRAKTGVYRTLLSIEQRLINQDGDEVWKTSPQEIPDLSDTPRREFYLAIGPIDFQQKLPPGRYKMVFDLRDQNSQQATTTELPFTITEK